VTEDRPTVQMGNISGVNGPVTGVMTGGDITGNYGAPQQSTRASAKAVSAEPKAPDALYHFAFTFAGEQRDYVSRTKDECEDLGLEVMYDLDRAADMLGENFIAQQRQIYSARTLFVVAFLSEDYLRKPVPRDEFKAAMWTDVQRGGGYILPILMDDVEVPSDMLHPGTSYIPVRDEQPGPQDLAVLLNRKVLASLLTDPRGPKRISEIVRDTLGKQPEPADPLDAIIEHLRAKITSGGQEIRQRGCILRLLKEDGVRCDVIRPGDPLYSLEVRRDRRVTDSLVIKVDRHTESGGELRDNAELVRDPYDSTPKVRLRKRGLLPGMTGDPVILTKEELSGRIWQDIMQRIG
jgi:TIR domain